MSVNYIQVLVAKVASLEKQQTITKWHLAA
jgi:hypothetical protein